MHFLAMDYGRQTPVAVLAGPTAHAAKQNLWEHFSAEFESSADADYALDGIEIVPCDLPVHPIESTRAWNLQSYIDAIRDELDEMEAKCADCGKAIDDDPGAVEVLAGSWVCGACATQRNRDEREEALDADRAEKEGAF